MRFESNLLFIFLIVVSLLLFGCTSPPIQNTPTRSANATPSASIPASPTATSPTPASPNLVGLGYSQLIALGVPIECDISSTTSSGPVTMKLYIDGAQKNRVEVHRSGSSCSQLAMVLRGTSMYLGCNDGSPYMNNCTWLQIDIPDSTADSAPSTSSSAPDYTNLPPTSYNCRLWIPDNSKFQTPGRVCDFSQIYGGTGAGYPSAPPSPE